MPGKRRMPVPDNQLTLIDIEPAPPKQKQKKPAAPKQTASLEQRVTQLEADVTRVEAALELEEEDYESD